MICVFTVYILLALCVSIENRQTFESPLFFSFCNVLVIYQHGPITDKVVQC